MEMEKLFTEISKIATSQAVMNSDIQRMKNDVEKLFDLIDTRFVTKSEFLPFVEELENKVTKEEFEPIKRLAYGAVTFILVAVLGLIFSSAIK